MALRCGNETMDTGTSIWYMLIPEWEAGVTDGPAGVTIVHRNRLIFIYAYII